MSKRVPTYSLDELCELTGVTRRTVRYYIQQGLLPSASRTGPHVEYSERYLLRLRLIVRLKEQEMSLARIREQLRGLQDDEIRELLNAPVPTSDGSPADYIRAVFERAERAPHERPIQGRRAAPPAELMTSRWERVEITPDIELHVRRPQRPRAQSQIEQLLDAARAIFHEGGHR
jgi:DNA-binding transcriptional MerR regulator